VGGPRRIALWALRALIVLLSLWAIFRLLGLESGYPLVAVLALTPYVAAIAVLVLAVSVYLRRLPESLVGGIVVALLALAVLPRVVPGQPTGPIDGGVRLELMTLNLHGGEADAAEVVDAVRRQAVDVLSAQELTESAVIRLRKEGIDDLLPEQDLGPTEGSGGAGLYSRYPLRPLQDVPGGISRMLRARVRVPRSPGVEVVAVHPFPPTDGDASDWRDGLGALPRADPEGPLRTLAGDFNATFDQAAFRDVVGSGYVDAADTRGLGLAPTWPADGTWAPPVTIDHVLVDERAHVGEVVLRGVSGTDHRAVIAELVLPARERG
jgi:hypothetical protein